MVPGPVWGRCAVRGNGGDKGGGSGRRGGGVRPLVAHTAQRSNTPAPGRAAWGVFDLRGRICTQGSNTPGAELPSFIAALGPPTPRAVPSFVAALRAPTGTDPPSFVAAVHAAEAPIRPERREALTSY